MTVKKMPRSQAEDIGRLYLNRVGLAGREHSIRRGCPADSSSACRSRARWRWSRPWCCSTSRRRRSIRGSSRDVAALLRLLDDLKKTLIVVTHDLDFAQAISDQVIYFEGGRAVESGRRAKSSRSDTARDARLHEELPRRPRRHEAVTRDRKDPAAAAGWSLLRCLVSAAADASAQSALERVRASGRLSVGIDATYPPFGIAEGGEFSGFDVDIARAVARELARRGGARQRQLRRRLSRAAERQLRRRHLGGDDHARARARRCCSRIRTSRRPADRRPQRQPDCRARRAGRAHRRRADQHDGAVRDGEAARRDDREVQHDRSRAAGSAERAHRRGGERRPGAALHDAPELPGTEDRRRRIHGRAVRRRARADERRPATRGQRRAVADPGQRRIREDLHQVVRRARDRRRRCSDAARVRYRRIIARTWRSSSAASG